jgi:hypothetical protein
VKYVFSNDDENDYSDEEDDEDEDGGGSQANGCEELRLFSFTLAKSSLHRLPYGTD